MNKHITVIFSALLPIAWGGCSVPAVKQQDNPVNSVQAAHAGAMTEFKIGMGLAVQGDMKAGLPHFSKIDPTALDPKKQAALAGILANFGAKGTVNDRSDLDPWTAKVLGAYQNYWSRAMMRIVTYEEGERELAETLAPLVGVAAGSDAPVDMGTLEPKLEEQLLARAYFSLHGVTPPFREFILWRTRRDQNYEVELPDGRESVSVAMLEDFISLGWTGFATGNYYHTAGWAKPDRLFCIRMAYDLESETFRISYLAHEAQHFADYKRFPNLEGPDLEYRAKLVEIAYADTTLGKLLGSFSERGSNDRQNPHGYANRRLINDLANALNIAVPADTWWESIQPATIRAAALGLLKKDSQRLERGRPR